jgi:hypothetical protein
MPAHVPDRVPTVVGGGGAVVTGGGATDAGALGVDELHAMPNPTSAVVVRTRTAGVIRSFYASRHMRMRDGQPTGPVLDSPSRDRASRRS